MTVDNLALDLIRLRYPTILSFMLAITEEYLRGIREILAKEYFCGWSPEYLASDAGKDDMEEHVRRRMMEAENRVIPWIQDVHEISGARVLEIGCGTGSSTIPFAMRASCVEACDIRDIPVATKRTHLFGLTNVRCHALAPNWALCNATETLDRFPGSFDVILLVALLEHLTIEERINVLAATWSKLTKGGILVAYETPNRIGYFDWHSFLLPFFNVLPDSLALLYQGKTPRPSFLAKDVESLYRLGRGVSGDRLTRKIRG
jgi:2-polyprenyl-3-methyl-5-hydroxy-6-metoxy-1,4-benzoquinol methylase